eukprot:6293097-Amphidinium_carterae.1
MPGWNLCVAQLAMGNPGTSKTGMARWHAASTDQNRSFMLQTIEALYSFLMVSTGGNSTNREKLR